MRRPGLWPPPSLGAASGLSSLSGAKFQLVVARASAVLSSSALNWVPLDGPIRPEVAVHRLMSPFVSLVAALILNLATVEASAADDVADFYRGKSVALVIGFGPGGGYDTYARVLARHLGRHIPG